MLTLQETCLHDNKGSLEDIPIIEVTLMIGGIGVMKVRQRVCITSVQRSG